MSPRWMLPLILLASSAFAADPPAGKKYALVVGVNQYRHTKLEKLRYAENDATELATTLKGAGFDVTLLVTAKGEGIAGEPTKAEIEKRIADVLADRRREDMVLIAFAGHGLQFEGDEEAYFCPIDAVPTGDAESRKSLVPLNGLYQRLDKSGAGVKLLLVDACRDDPTAGRGASRGVDGSTAPRLPRGTAVLFSCSAGERAFEHDNFRHGVFFHYVLEGLRGKAKNEDGEVTWDRLVDYTKRHVAREVPKIVRGGAQQSPVHFTGGIAGEPPILIPPGAAHNVRATLDFFWDQIDKATAAKLKLSQKLQPMVTFVVPGSGADRMGLRGEDVILAINGRDGLNTDALTAAISELAASERVQLIINRGGQTLTLTGVNESKYPDTEKFTRVRQAAQAGDIWAMDSLAYCYIIGDGTTENDVEALRWFRKSAEAGVFCSQRWLGLLLAQGRGTARDDQAALRWYRKAADQGDAESQNLVGVIYAEGRGATADVEEAAKWYRLAATQGHAWGQFNLARAYFEGNGVAKDLKLAKSWCEKAANQRMPEAQMALGEAYAAGTGVKQSDQEAFRWFKKAADLNFAEAQNKVGVSLYDGRGVTQDQKEAIRWFQKAAAQNFAWAQYNLGDAYLNGRGVTEDSAEAFRWYRKAANQDLPDGTYMVGRCFQEGWGVGVNLERAAESYRKAADAGLAVAQNILGNMYFWGRGVTKDRADAVVWYRKAADQGFANGQYNLGWCLYHGEGVKADQISGLKLLKLAADQGQEDAKKELQRLSDK